MEVGPLVGSGRDCDVFDVGPGRVVRRNRNGRNTEVEALTMTHLRAHNYPVPEVFDAAGADIVMERLDGPTMVDAFARRPWRLSTYAHQLADLIGRLQAVPLPDHDLPQRVPPGEVLVHLDLHPLNVMLTPKGPVVIDWTGACTGAPGLDAANTWLTVAAGQVDATGLERALIGVGRRALLARLRRAVDTTQTRQQLGTALAFRRSDPNLSDAEVATMEAIVAAKGEPC